MIKIQAPELYRDSGAYEARKGQSLRARYVYGLIFFATNLLAWFIRDYGAKLLGGLHHIPVCGAGDSKCFRSGGVLRVSLGCFIFFWVMFATTFRTRKLQGVRNSWHSGCWALKFLVYVVSIVTPFIIPDIFIQLYGEIARMGAGIFLILQLISMLHLISWCNKCWMPDPGSNQCGLFGLFLSTVSFIASFAGILVLYILYVPNSSCVFNIFTIIWTAVLVKIMMAVSLHSKFRLSSPAHFRWHSRRRQSRGGPDPGKQHRSASCHKGSGPPPGTANSPLRRAESAERPPAPPLPAAPPSVQQPVKPSNIGHQSVGRLSGCHRRAEWTNVLPQLPR